jgi:hypothetical protein
VRRKMMAKKKPEEKVTVGEVNEALSLLGMDPSVPYTVEEMTQAVQNAQKLKTEREQNRRQATQDVERLVREARSKLAEAEQISKKYDVPVYFNLEYGMGGYFDPREDRWVSSSENC